METGHDMDTAIGTGARENLLGKPEIALSRFFSELGEKPFRARQVLQWIHQRHATRFDDMTDLSKSLRTRLGEIATACRFCTALPTGPKMNPSWSSK